MVKYRMVFGNRREVLDIEVLNPEPQWIMRRLVGEVYKVPSRDGHGNRIWNPLHSGAFITECEGDGYWFGIVPHHGPVGFFNVTEVEAC